MASNRRMGPRDSDTSNVLLDATEQVMRKEGYAAVSSRRVAEEAGVKQPLVYYYFHTIDDLLLAAFKRRTERGYERIRRDLASDQPIRALWDDISHRTDPRLTFEYMALANHHDGIRAEVAKFVGETRRMQTEALSRRLGNSDMGNPNLTPAALSFLFTGISLMLEREVTAGITSGHEDVRALIEQLLERIDPA